MLRWCWLALLVIVLDQATKVWAESQLALYRPLEVFPGLSWTLSYNPGAAFSFLADAGGWQRWFFTVLALGVSAFIIHWLRKLQRGDVVLAVALCLIMGGAIGNAWDRLYLGHVVDFIDVHYFASECLPMFGQSMRSGSLSCHWPAFNIADSAIFIGAMLMIGDSLRRRPNEKSDSKSALN